MTEDLTYSEAYKKLEELIAQLEDGDIQLEDLAAKAKQANELIAICEVKLRTITQEVTEATKTAKTRKK